MCTTCTVHTRSGMQSLLHAASIRNQLVIKIYHTTRMWGTRLGMIVHSIIITDRSHIQQAWSSYSIKINTPERAREGVCHTESLRPVRASTSWLRLTVEQLIFVMLATEVQLDSSVLLHHLSQWPNHRLLIPLSCALACMYMYLLRAGLGHVEYISYSTRLDPLGKRKVWC